MRFLSLLLSVLALVTALLCIFALHDKNMLQAFGWHSAGSFCGILAVITGRVDKSLPPFEASLACIVPVFGGTCAAYYTFALSGRKSAGAFDEYQEHLAGETLAQNKKNERFNPNPEKLQSLLSVLKSDQPLLDKRTAIESLGQLETPESISILRQALCLDSVEVRFFAASIISKLEDKLTASLKRRDIRAQADDASDADIFSVAQAYFEFCYYTIAEGEREIIYLNKALTYIKSLNMLTARSSALELAGRIELRLGGNRQAMGYFTELLKRDDFRKQEGFLWCAEASYALGEFMQTREYCKMAYELGPIPLRMRSNINFWLGKSA